jgi:hypothetical protein
MPEERDDASFVNINRKQEDMSMEWNRDGM